MSKADLAAAVAAATTEAQAELAGATEDKSKEATEAKASEGDKDKAKETPTSKDVGAPVETPDAEKTATEIADFQAAWGVNLSGLPDDEAQKFITEFRESQREIGKLQREKAEAEKAAVAARTPAPAPASEPVEVASITDEQLAAALGLDLQNSMDPARDQREIQLTRSFLEQQEKLDRLEQGVVASSTATKWERAFNDLESRFGKLPEGLTRDEVAAMARDNGIASPEAAYWAAVGPVRADVAQALEKRLVELRTTSKKGATTPRPGTSAEVDNTKLESKNVKDGIREAFQRAAKEMGADQYA